MDLFDKIDIFFANAGSSDSTPVALSLVDVFDRVLRTNVTATFLNTRKGVPHESARVSEECGGCGDLLTGGLGKWKRRHEYARPFGWKPTESAGHSARRRPDGTRSGGKYKVWTKRIGSGRLKLLVLHGGPGFSHEYLEALEAFLPDAGVEMYYYDQLGCNNSDHPALVRWSACNGICTAVSTAPTWIGGFKHGCQFCIVPSAYSQVEVAAITCSAGGDDAA